MAGSRTAIWLTGLVVLSGLPVGLRAQLTPSDSAGAPLLSSRDWVLVGGLVGAQIALFPFDDDVRRSVQHARSGATDRIADAVRPLGRLDVAYVAAASAFALGRLADRPRLADVGVHGFLSVTLATAVTGTLKGFAGRARPLTVDVQGADTVWTSHGSREWDALAGWTEGSGRQSYPSGHTTDAFVVATVLSEEFGGAMPWLAYPLAAAVGWSRLNDEAHWATDVAMGALVGIVSGRLVVRHGHRGGGWFERTFLLERSPSGGGLAIGFRVPVGSSPRPPGPSSDAGRAYGPSGPHG